MMADRELLELAAKAAGYKYRPANECIVVDGVPGRWTPLTDDGDALRLAVRLRLDIEWDEPEAVIASSHFGESNRQLTEWTEHNGCAASATRRAIVRAAAEIGRSMP